MSKISPPVIYYHSVAPNYFDQWILKWLTLKLELFEDQLQFLKSRNYRGINLDEWLAIRQGTRSRQGDEVLLTFDDGLLDNWVYVYPLAKKFGIRVTFFVSPDRIDPNNQVRPNLEDVWAGRCGRSELADLGYCSWAELKVMQESGWVDIQSHTMTHLKYPASDRIKQYYYGGHQGMHAILIQHPELLGTYPKHPEFETLLPKGTPLFEQKSAVVVRKHEINEAFVDEVLAEANTFQLQDDHQQTAFESRANQIAATYRQNGNLISSIESESEQRARMYYEIAESKRQLEEQLSKPVQFMCWPHGDNSHEAHQMAKEVGYLASTAGKLSSEEDELDRIPRFGASTFRDHRWLSRVKFHYKLASHLKQQPFHTVAQLNELKNKLLK